MGGSSGGSSGKVSYPDYMQDQHELWLDDIAALITTGIAASPYVSAVAYDPDTDLAAIATELASLDTVVNAIDISSSWSTYFDTVDSNLLSSNVTLNTTYDSTFDTDIDIEAQIDAHKAILNSDLTLNVLPQYKRSMQNVGAAMTSAFIIGEAMIIARRDEKLDKFQQDLELKQLDFNIKQNEFELKESDFDLRQKELEIKQNQINALQNQKAMDVATALIDKDFNLIDAYKTLLHYTTEVNRIKIVAKSEEAVTNLEYDVKDAQWDFTLYTEGANMLAAISGSATQTPSGPNKAQSVIGGALSGVSAVSAGAAAMGTVASGGTLALGAGIGAALGLF